MPPFFRALRSRNYRLYFLGQVVSLVGTWMQQVAMLWLAYRLSGSALTLGTVGFASQIPILIFASLGGVWIDRFDRRRLLLWTQSLSLLQSLLLAVLVWQEMVSPGLLVLLAFILGCLNAVDVPARQSIAAQLVESPADLQNAIALNSIVIQSARFIGPALAGVVVATVGEAVCFLINAFSYLAVLLALSLIRTTSVRARPTPTLQALREGFHYARGHRQIRSSLFLVASISFFATPYTVMMPLFAREIFGGDASTYGGLIASAGAGSLLAAVALASLADTRKLQRWIGWAATLVGISLAVFAMTPVLGLAYPALAVLGFAVIITFSGSNTLIQTQLAESYRGRVMAIYTMAFLGVAPLGSLAVGAVAELIDIRLTLVICGAVSLLVALRYRQSAASIEQSS